MKLRGNIWHLVGIGACLLTALLFQVRAIDPSESQRLVEAPLGVGFESGTSHYTLYYGGDPVGGVRAARSQSDSGLYQYDVDTQLRLEAFGRTIDVDVSITAQFDRGFGLKQVRFEMQSGATNLSGTAITAGNELVVNLQTGGVAQTHRFPFDKNMIIGSVLGSRITADSLKPGDVRRFKLFDPLTQNIRKTKLTAIAYEDVYILDQKVRALKFKQETMGVSLHGWVSESGEMLKQELGLGLVAKLEPKSVAQHHQSQNGKRVDLIAEVMIPVPNMPRGLEQLERITYRITGLPSTIDVSKFERQFWQAPVLKIEREKGPVDAPFERGTPRISKNDLLSQAGHPEIRSVADTIVKDAKTIAQLSRNAMAWFKTNIKQEPVASLPAALETLRTKTGDCNEHAFLFAGLMRTLGIETNVVAGLAYLPELKTFGYHAWNEIKVGESFVSIDVTWRQFPADLSHIALVRGGLEAQGYLWSVMGRLDIEVMGSAQ